MTTLFISDLHLTEDELRVEEAFVEFIDEHATNAEALYILGDFFEVWLGDDDDTPFNRRIIDTLAALPVDKYIMHGNRDFLIGEAFCAAAGLTLLPDPTVINLYGTPVLCMHGDSLCTRDEAYMETRKMLRNPAFKQELLSQPLPVRADIARGARDQSKVHTRETAMDIMDVTLEEVTRELHEHETTLLLHGHTHRPAIHDHPVNGVPGTRIVLGDWGTHAWYLAWDESGYDLRSYGI
ncbi:MAG: UDP-2,3-diacylglucosamine diphosphatase [Gammaproteobacteria bacterium]|nr:UDP-2,3-diacylglucosamine diphosphatase [Gammaproteobacteria bacterium]RPG25097.1 MAG: UDP-2,3-diacylglucosamine diphosphatase [Gammaproteobacteria bacterium TMED50]